MKPVFARSWSPALRLWIALTATLSTTAFGQTDEAAVPPRESSVELPAESAERVEFIRDIRPIFAQHCLACHGPEEQGGGLRLDQRQHAESGGDTGRPILSGTLETNEIYRRISSTDSAYRMPKRSEAGLNPREIDLIKRWVEAGTPWPTETALKPLPWPELLFLQLDSWFTSLEKLTEPNPYRREMLILLPIVLVGFLLNERAKRRTQKKPVESRSLVDRLVLSLDASHLLAFLVLFALSFALLVQHGELRELRQSLTQAESTIARVTRRSFLDVLKANGDPPMPFRPNHGRALSQRYYRGNCERNAKLFNHGNYCTAVFTISLRDENGNELRYGESLPARALLRFELERPPLTTPSLYNRDIIDTLFLTQTYLPSSTPNAPKGPVLPLSTEKVDWKWSCDFPLHLTSEKRQQGMLYVYTGRPATRSSSGVLQFGIRYDLSLTEEGKLAEESEIWMGCYEASAMVETPTSADKIPFLEWFDTRPIPFITGENSTDPKLLGIDEHRQNPLFHPEKSTSPDEDRSGAASPPEAPQDGAPDSLQDDLD